MENETLVLKVLNVVLARNAKDETRGTVNFMGGSFFVSGFLPEHKDGPYPVAHLACETFQGNPSPRRLLTVESKQVKV